MQGGGLLVYGTVSKSSCRAQEISDRQECTFNSLFYKRVLGKKALTTLAYYPGLDGIAGPYATHENPSH
jgi:hypothetical protein